MMNADQTALTYGTSKTTLPKLDCIVCTIVRSVSRREVEKNVKSPMRLLPTKNDCYLKSEVIVKAKVV